MSFQFFRTAYVALLIVTILLAGCASNPTFDSFEVEDYGPLSTRSSLRYGTDSRFFVAVGIRKTTRTIPMDERLVFGVKVRPISLSWTSPVPVTFTWKYPREMALPGYAPALSSSSVIWLQRNNSRYFWALVEDKTCEEVCGTWTLEITSENGINEVIDFEVVPADSETEDANN